MKVLFVVCKENDNYPVTYNSRKAPVWMKKQLDNFRRFVVKEDKEVPNDVAMAMYLANKHPSDTFECLDGQKLTSTNQLDSYDAVFVICDPTEVFNCQISSRKPTCPRETKAFLNALQKTKAFVFPYPEFHAYILEKPRYYADLERANLPVVPFMLYKPEQVLTNIDNFRRKVEEKGWEGVIIKPTYAGYSIGIKVFSDFKKTTNNMIKKQFEKLAKLQFPSVTVAEFVPSFGKHFEIRTYWINEKYAYSVATLTKKVGKEGGLDVDDETTFKSEGGKLSDKLKKELIDLGADVIKALPQYPYPQPFMRIDFGCCIPHGNGCAEHYFINEVETLAANMLASETKYPVVEKTADALYQLLVNHLPQKTSPPFRPSTFVSDKNYCKKLVGDKDTSREKPKRRKSSRKRRKSSRKRRKSSTKRRKSSRKRRKSSKKRRKSSKKRRKSSKKRRKSSKKRRKSSRKRRKSSRKRRKSSKKRRKSSKKRRKSSRKRRKSKR